MYFLRQGRGPLPILLPIRLERGPRQSGGPRALKGVETALTLRLVVVVVVVDQFSWAVTLML